MQYNASVMLIQCFVASYPDSVRVADNEGNYPVHCAFLEGSRTFNLRQKLPILLQVFPESAQLCNFEGLTPIGIAEKFRRRNCVNSLDYNIEAPIREMMKRPPSEWQANRAKKKAETRRARSDGYDAFRRDESPQKRPRKASLTTDSSKEGASTTAPSSSSYQCVACQERIPSYALVPCGHVALCGQCAEIDRLIELKGCKCF